LSLAVYNPATPTDLERIRALVKSDAKILVDRTIVKWIETNWTTHPWFAGGDSYVISLNVDPAIRQVVFRKS
jgi:hypothetical protein